jgi:N-acetyl-anhydromuramyl-L-alanine amidase AmpD
VALHTTGHNESSIAVGLVHMPGKESYPDVQLKSLVELLAEISSRYNIDISKILTAQEVSGNRPDSDITKMINKIREDVQKEKARRG